MTAPPVLPRWSPERDKIAAALLAFQAVCPSVKKGEFADAGAKKYRYADIADCIETARPHLQAARLSVIQPPAGTSICTVVLHESGQWLESTLDLATPGRPDDPQAWGSVITYFRRYAFLATLGIAADDEDDDGAAGRAKPEPTRGQPARGPGPAAGRAATPARGNGGQARGGTAPEDVVLPIGKLKGRRVGTLTDNELAAERDFYLDREQDQRRKAAWRAEDRAFADACAAVLARRGEHDTAERAGVPQASPYAGSGQQRGPREAPDNNPAWGLGGGPGEDDPEDYDRG